MSAVITATRSHTISCGHRVVGHESKCKDLHGHNYTITVTVEAKSLDKVGRVLDFGFMKSLFCQWLEDNWDHKFLMWRDDPLWDRQTVERWPGTIAVDFNPTAENMAEYLLRQFQGLLHINTDCRDGKNVQVVSVKVQETPKCSATAVLAPLVVEDTGYDTASR